MEDEDIVVNGKVYTMWQQFVQKKDEWIGGILTDYHDSFDRSAGNGEPMKTKIKDIELIPNGKDGAAFHVVGEEFTCGGSVEYLGIMGADIPEMKHGICIGGYGGHKWTIEKLEK